MFSSTLTVSEQIKEVSWSPAYRYFGLKDVVFPSTGVVEVLGDRVFEGTRLA